MAEKTVVITQHLLKPIKILKWKVHEGNSMAVGRIILLYQFEGADKEEQRKLKSTQAGIVCKIICEEGSVINTGEPLLELKACIHPTVMNDMCAECGTDLRTDDEISTTASVPMVHSIPDLKVSEEQAQKLGRADGERLLKDRKLVLLVDLDQTLIHTTNDNIPANIKDVYHFQLYGPCSPWYHTRLRPGTHEFLHKVSSFLELHICTFGARNYAHTIAMFLDSDQRYFSNRILSRDECFDPTSKKANLKALFPCGDDMVCIIDDREDVWSHALNLIHVKPYHFFQHTGDINAPPGLNKQENDNQEGVDLSKLKIKPNGKNIKSAVLAIHTNGETNLKKDSEEKDNENGLSNKDNENTLSSVVEENNKVNLIKDNKEGDVITESEIKQVEEQKNNEVNNEKVRIEENLVNVEEKVAIEDKPNIKEVIVEEDKTKIKQAIIEEIENKVEDKSKIEESIEDQDKSEEEKPKIEEDNSKIKDNLKVVEDNPKIEENDSKIKDNLEMVEDNPKIGIDDSKIKDNLKVVEDNPKIEENDSKIKDNLEMVEDNPKIGIDDSKIKDSLKMLEDNPKLEENDSKIKDNLEMVDNPKIVEDDPKIKDTLRIVEDNSKIEKDVSKTKDNLGLVEDNPKIEEDDPKIEKDLISNVEKEDLMTENKDNKMENEKSEELVVDKTNELSNVDVKDKAEVNIKAPESKLLERSEKSSKNMDDDGMIEVEDSDDYLMYLEEILKRIHTTFYEEYDQMEAGNVPDLKQVIPRVRSRVLAGTRLVFSGLVPTHVKLEQSRAYQVARALGATITADITAETTHLVAVRVGTAKVNAGRRRKQLRIVTPDWLWCCAERWERVPEEIFPLSSKGSKNRHPPPHCSSPEHIPTYPTHDKPGTRKRTPSGRFMDTINPLMSFSSDDIADMDKEVEDMLDDESESDDPTTTDATSTPSLPPYSTTDHPSPPDNDRLHPTDDSTITTTTTSSNSHHLQLLDTNSSSSSEESLTGEFPRGFKRTRDRCARERREERGGGDSSAEEEEFPSSKFRRGEQLDSDLDIGQESNSEGSVEPRDDVDDGDWNIMGAALEREFLSNN